VKAGWETRPLGEVCDFEGGSQPPKAEFIYEEKSGYVRFLQIRDFASDKNITYIPQSAKNRLCNEGDTLIGRYGASVGKILTDKAGAYNVALMKTIPNLAVLDRSWFRNYLVSDEFQSRLLNVADRSAQAGFSKDDINSFPVPIPPLPEQRRIVGVLDEAFEGVATAKANAEKNLQNARALFESHLQSVFTQRGDGWEERQLGEVCDFEGGSQPPKSQFIYAPKAGYVRFLQIRDFGSDKHITYIPESPKNRSCREDDIMIGRYGASVGKILKGRSGAYNVALMKTVPNPEVLDRDFFHQYLISGGFQDLLRRVADRSAQNGFSKEDIFPFPVPVPPLQEQRTIVGRLGPFREETQRLASIYQQKLAALDELKKSLLHQAFSGEL
jgi:type I restriction enzyme S subunit